MKVNAYYKFLLLLLVVFTCNARAYSSAVILLYHHVADNTPASTSVSPEVFAEHLAYIAEHHQVLPLAEVIEAITTGTPLPDNTIVITFDDGYENIFTNGHPLLRKYQFPYTVFLNPGNIGVQRNQLTWDQVRQMQKEGATFANHTMSHAHLLEREPGEEHHTWLARVMEDIETAEKMLEEHTRESLRYLAYPFGEYDLALAEAILQQGYIGFGQHSGAIGVHSDRAALPRYPAAGIYARLSSLSPKMRSLAFPVLSTSVKDPNNPPLQQGDWVTLELDTTVKDARFAASQCFFAGKPITTEYAAPTLRFQLPNDLPIGRSRVNCTAPSSQGQGRFYWYSHPFFRADKNGRYPD